MPRASVTVTNATQRAARTKAIEKEKQQEAAERESAEKNQQFVQFSRKAMPHFIALIAEERTAAQVLIYMAQHMSYMNEISVSLAALETACNLSTSSINRAMKALKRNNWLRVESAGSARIYRINANAFWTTRATVKNARTNFRDALLVDGQLLFNEPAQQVQRRFVPVVRKKGAKQAPS